jgi:hypothetical protein
LEFLLLSPNKSFDFKDLLGFVEDGNLDFIRLSTIIIVLWKPQSKGDIPAINKDIEDIKKYLGITSNVNPLNAKDSKKVSDLLNEKI